MSGLLSEPQKSRSRKDKHCVAFIVERSPVIFLENQYVPHTADLKLIKDNILLALEEQQVEAKDIILFGSRARKDHKINSDWDILVVLGKKVSRERRIDITHTIGKRLAEDYIPSDVLVRSEEEIEERKNIVGSVIKRAIKEGISI